MGMFDYVKTPDISCPRCGALVTGFQSKDLGCDLVEVDFTEVQEFYSSCKKCDLWMLFKRKLPPATSLDDFVLTGEEP